MPELNLLLLMFFRLNSKVYIAKVAPFWFVCTKQQRLKSLKNKQKKRTSNDVLEMKQLKQTLFKNRGDSKYKFIINFLIESSKQDKFTR